MDAIYSGIPWYDNNGNVVSAHGAGMIKANGRYYLFGEFKSENSNAFNGFSCYSSSDLYNWTFEKIVLPMQDSGRLGPNRIGERPKVMQCPKTGEYVMYMHTDDIRYGDPCIGYATCKTIDGQYTFHGPLLFNGKPIRLWDMDVFQDTNGSGYVITHSGNLYKLSNDYKSVTKQVVKNMTSDCEAPTIFKKKGVYFWLGSNLTSWERNDNYYFTATSLKGPWIRHGLFAPKKSLTWNSQTTFVLPIAGSKDTTFMYMGDRWAFPRQHSAATYVWQPLMVIGDSIFLPDYKGSWQINTKTGTWLSSTLKGMIIENSDTKQIKFSDGWTQDSLAGRFTDRQSNIAGAFFSLNFQGSQIGIYGIGRPDGGYAEIKIQNSTGETILSSLIDMYCKYSESSLKFLSQVLKKGQYKLIVLVVGEHGNWYRKKGTEYGSSGNYVSVNKIIVKN